MSEVPENLKYSASHEWVRAEPDGSVVVGITHHAQDLLGDMVYIELPEVGRALRLNEECAVVESVKAASDVYAPIAGTIEAVNSELTAQPELINTLPYSDGWLFRLRPEMPTALNDLLDADGYRRQLDDDSGA